LVDGLIYLHEHHKIAHLDLNTRNIMINNLEENPTIKIIDFGCSTIFRDEKVA